MKDEIKEKIKAYYIGNDINKLLDYITNLQEELKSANESITWWQNRFNALQEENKEIKNTIDFIDNKYKNTINYNEKLIEYNQNYKSRIDKAIEYLPKVRRTTSYELDEKIDNLEYILNGGDDNGNI